MTALCCSSVTVGYRENPVLNGLNLKVGSGEAVAVLGPSGSGKTTLLNAIAGFIPIWAGSVEIAGVMASSRQVMVPPDKRSVGFVFQSYALWPHMSALDNVAYPYRRRGLPSAQARERAQELLAGLGLGEETGRRADELSGGQQQRVGLARALAREPTLFLFDEPTAHLDGPLRVILQEQVTVQRRQSGAAAVYSTHDAGEALAVADRVAILKDGQVVQTGSPAEVYEQPLDRWVAELTGPASVLEAPFDTVSESRITVRLGQASLDVMSEGTGKKLLVRPEWAEIGGPLPGTIAAVFYRGPFTDFRLDTPAGPMMVRSPGSSRARVGDRPGWRLTRVWVF